MPEETPPAPPASPLGTVLYVCTQCRGADDPPDGPRPGARLLAAIEGLLAASPVPGLRAEGVACLSVCKRPCTVAVASPGRWTYLYGDLDAEESARTILDGVTAYAATPDGIVPWRERPAAFRTGVVARVPPLPVALPAADPTPAPAGAQETLP